MNLSALFLNVHSYFSDKPVLDFEKMLATTQKTLQKKIRGQVPKTDLQGLARHSYELAELKCLRKHLEFILGRTECLEDQQKFSHMQLIGIAEKYGVITQRQAESLRHHRAREVSRKSRVTLIPDEVMHLESFVFKNMPAFDFASLSEEVIKKQKAAQIKLHPDKSSGSSQTEIEELRHLKWHLELALGDSEYEEGPHKFSHMQLIDIAAKHSLITKDQAENLRNFRIKEVTEMTGMELALNEIRRIEFFLMENISAFSACIRPESVTYEKAVQKDPASIEHGFVK